MANDSPANEGRPRSPAHRGVAGCLAILSVLLGVLLLLPGLCTFLFGVYVGHDPSQPTLLSSGLVLIAGGVAFVVGAVKIWTAGKGPDAHNLPGPAATLPEAPDRTGSGVPAVAPQRAPPPRDVRDIGGGFIIVGLIILLIFALLLVTQLR